MHADPAAQQRLLSLADLDSEAARVRHAAKTLPQHQLIADLTAARQAVTDELVATSTQVDDLQVAVRKAESDLEPVRARLVRDQQRIDDGTVTDPKILSSLTDEVAQITRRISEFEDGQLELMGQLEEASSYRDEVAQRKTNIEAKLREAVAGRDEAVELLRREAEDLAETRAPIVKQLPADLFALYEKLRGTTGLGAAPLRAGKCGGCQLQATIADLNSYRQAAADEVLRCLECDRILVRTPESGL